MREVIVRFPMHALDDVLDRILPIVPDGVREAAAPRGQIELRMLGPHLPSLRDIAQAVRPTPFQISERQVPDDWRERRLADYQPYWAARGALLAKAGRRVEAHEALTVAAGLSADDAVRRYLLKQRDDLASLN